MPNERGPESADTVLEAIRSRRVTRAFEERAVTNESLVRVLEAGRWATSGGNRRIHRFLVVRDPGTLARLRAVTPGMFSAPPVVIVICTDATRAAEELVQLEHDATTWIDVGTAAMNMMVAAHALELGTCPVTSFSHGAVRVVLGLPPTVEPELFLLRGPPLQPARLYGVVHIAPVADVAGQCGRGQRLGARAHEAAVGGEVRHRSQRAAAWVFPSGVAAVRLCRPRPTHSRGHTSS